MASFLHEALVLLFRNRPELAPELLRDALGVAVPEYTEARIESGDLTQAVPAEFRADLVVLLLDGRPVLAVVVEVQLRRDERKRYTWPHYTTSVRARFECPAVVLVVTASVEVARWAGEPISIGAGSTFLPLVVGPEGAPAVTDAERARRAPELAVLGAVAHGAADPPDRAVALAVAALGAVAGLNDERALVYSDLVMAALGEAARAALEELMATGGYEFQSEFAKKHRAAGRAEGEAKGRAEGEAKGRAEAVLAVLEARGVTVSEAERARIRACTDLATLERWVRAAVTVRSADELTS